MNYIYSENPVNDAASHLAAVIRLRLLEGQTVLWLLSGGSGVKIGIQASHLLADVDLSKLSVTLTDERYGPVNHEDENWRQLDEGGLSLPGAQLYRPLIGKDRTETASEFADWLQQQVAQANYTIGLFGIGADGHTAGIKPHSLAVDSAAFAVGYVGEDFERITMTSFAITQVDEIVVQASGQTKQAVVAQLLSSNQPLAEQPAQILKQIPLVTIYGDNEV